ncbi:hypothetical protein, partial [uncultured Duncaniella sp.]|uniref:hypothetical protein n=1 Tax=uncultured Duncaniella sp. TaxID=2768039 RepID=UPI002676266E
DKRLRVSSGIDPHLGGGGIAVVDTIGISCKARFILRIRREQPGYLSQFDLGRKCHNVKSS